MQFKKLKIFLLFSGIIYTFGVTATFACRPIEKPSATTTVENAEIIVRAEADKYVEEPTGDIRALNEPDNATVNFKVKEVLKGESFPSELVLNGYLTDRDDFNDAKVPYNFVRLGGRGGSCSAYEYKKGAEFLLFLKKIGEKYTVRWYALAPTNEQLHSSNDEWITWVRKYLNEIKSKQSVKMVVQPNELIDKRRTDLIFLKK